MLVAQAARLNLRVRGNGSLCISLDETTTRADIELLWRIFGGEGATLPSIDALDATAEDLIPAELRRQSPFLTHPVFNTHHSEHELLRYMRALADKGTTVIFSTHVIAHAERLCDEVGIIRKGKLIAKDAPETLMKTDRAQTLEDLFLNLTEKKKNRWK